MINILFININDFVFYTTIIVIVLLVFTIFFLIAKLKKIVDEVEISKLKTFESEETIKFANHRIKNNTNNQSLRNILRERRCIRRRNKVHGTRWIRDI